MGNISIFAYVVSSVLLMNVSYCSKIKIRLEQITKSKMSSHPTDTILTINKAHQSKLPINEADLFELLLDEAHDSKIAINGVDEVILSQTLQKYLHDMQNHMSDYYPLLEHYEKAEEENERLQQQLSRLDASNEYLMILEETVEVLYQSINMLEKDIESVKLDLLESRVKTDMQEKRLSQINDSLNEMNDTKQASKRTLPYAASRFNRFEASKIMKIYEEIRKEIASEPNIPSLNNNCSAQFESWHDLMARDSFIRPGGLFADVRKGGHNATFDSVKRFEMQCPSIVVDSCNPNHKRKAFGFFKGK